MSSHEISCINSRYTHSVIDPFIPKIGIKCLFGAEDGSKQYRHNPGPHGQIFYTHQEFHGEEVDLEKHASAWHIYPKVSKYSLKTSFVFFVNQRHLKSKPVFLIGGMKKR